MPINPEIALQVKNPQFENPLDSYARVVSLANLRQQGQLQQQQMQMGQQQIQGAQLENQQRQLTLDDAKAFNEAVKGNIATDANGNVTINHAAVMSNLAKAGAAPQLMSYQANLAKMRAEELQRQKAELEVNSLAADAIGRDARSASNQEGWTARLSRWAKQGYDVSSIPVLYSKQAQQQVIDGALTTKDFNDLHFKMTDQELKEREFQLKKDSANQPKFENVPEGSTPGYFDPKTRTWTQIGTPTPKEKGVDLQEMTDWIQKNPGKGPADFKQYEMDQAAKNRIQVNLTSAENHQALANAPGPEIADNSKEYR